MSALPSLFDPSPDAASAGAGLRFNAVAPGMTGTPLTAGMLKVDAMPMRRAEMRRESKEP